MIWWVNVRGKDCGKDVEFFYIIEADSNDEALLKAADNLKVKMLDEVTSVHAERG